MAKNPSSLPIACHSCPFTRPRSTRRPSPASARCCARAGSPAARRCRLRAAALGVICGGRPCAPSTPAPAPWKSRFASPASARRRGHHHAADLGGHGQCDSRSGRRPVLVDVDPADAQHRPRTLPKRDHAAHEGDHPGGPGRPAGRPRPAVRPSPAPRTPARHRGRGAEHRRFAGRARPSAASATSSPSASMPTRT
jgi:hypothetical protein